MGTEKQKRDILDDILSNAPLEPALAPIETVMAGAEAEIIELTNTVIPRSDGKQRMMGTKRELELIAKGERPMPVRKDGAKAYIPDLPMVTKQLDYPIDSPCHKCGNSVTHLSNLIGCNEELINEKLFEKYAYQGGCPKWIGEYERKARNAKKEELPLPGATLYARTPAQDERPEIMDEQPWHRRRPGNFPMIGTYIGRWTENAEATALIEYARTPYGLSRVKELESVLESPRDEASPTKCESVTADDIRLSYRQEIGREARNFMSFSKDGASAYCPITKQEFTVTKMGVIGNGALSIMCPYCEREHTAPIGNENIPEDAGRSPTK